MKKLILILILSFSLFTSAFSQNSIDISGYTKDANDNIISGVTMTFSNGGGTVVTNSNGFYRKAVNRGWSGRVTPSKSGWSFSPAYKSYSNVASDKSYQNYSGGPWLPFCHQ